MKQVKRGEIYYADLSPVVGSEQGGVRPVLVLQNDKGNCYSPICGQSMGSNAGVTRKREMPRSKLTYNNALRRSAHNRTSSTNFRL